MSLSRSDRNVAKLWERGCRRDVRSGRDPYRNVHLYPFGLPLNSNRGANDARTKLKRILSLWQTQYPFNFNILNVSIEQLKEVYSYLMPLQRFNNFSGPLSCGRSSRLAFSLRSVIARKQTELSPKLASSLHLGIRHPKFDPFPEL